MLVPAAVPVTTPVREPIAAVNVFELVQAPPAVASFKVIVPPHATTEAPVIAAGIA